MAQKRSSTKTTPIKTAKKAPAKLAKKTTAQSVKKTAAKSQKSVVKKNTSSQKSTAKKTPVATNRAAKSSTQKVKAPRTAPRTPAKSPSLAQRRNTERTAVRKQAPIDTSKIVPDTSVLVEGVLSKELLHISVKEIIIHEAVVAELEAQANKRKQTGYQGLDEIERIKDLGQSQGFTLRFAGERPAEFEIRYAKSGEIDSLIRDLAQVEGAVLYTADVVQGKVARAKGIPVMLHQRAYEKTIMSIEGFFSEGTMSVHIKENTAIMAKNGRPGEWEFATVRQQLVKRHEVQQWEQEILQAARSRKDSFVEIERKGSTIVQVGNYRIVITRPPFSDGYEITAVRPVTKLTFEEYHISDKLVERIDLQAEGILIAGAPGHGKSTFAQALAGHYLTKEKIIKTVEAPRDMVLPDEITQYAISHGTQEEVHDILLLSRPDYTFFDEMRNTEDFKLFADMRLSGVGMIGVMHATKPIDAIQRFLGRIELGVIPHVVDTVIFIKDGAVAAIYAISMTVKVPSGMSEADLARPIVEIHDFQSNKLIYEVYTYGEQTVVIPVKAGEAQSSVHKFAQEGFRKYFERYASNPRVEVVSNNKITVRVAESEMAGLIGRGGENIQRLEKEIGMNINVESGGVERDKKDSYSKNDNGRSQGKKKSSVPFGVLDTKTSLLFNLGKGLANSSVDISVDGDFLLTAHASKKGQVKLAKKNKLVQLILDGLEDELVSITPSG